MAKVSVLERLQRNSIVPEGACWVWTGSVDKDGYGRIKVDGAVLKTHRVSYALHYGVEVATSMDIDHQCRNHACWNPSHLRLQSQNENRSEGARYRWHLWRSKNS